MSHSTQKLRQTLSPQIAAWRKLAATYQQSSVWRASWQLVNTLGSLLAVWVLMYFTKDISWWLTIPLAVLAGGLLVRTFIIFHDCTHGSCFKSRRANAFWGFICGVLTVTPFFRWRWEHARHHATSGNLDKRGTGDIWTMTVSEYLAASRWEKLRYRMARNPVVLFVIGPLYLFLVKERFPNSRGQLRERMSVWWNNLAILLMMVGLSHLFGLWHYLVIQLVALWVAGAVGVWLFYVQHQFEDTYWEDSGEWDYVAAALKGSSYYQLPKVLQWFSGNIGFHHIHHLNPNIPNYNLERCHKAVALFREVRGITLWASLKTLSYRLWDESNQRLIGFRQLRRMQAAA